MGNDGGKIGGGTGTFDDIVHTNNVQKCRQPKQRKNKINLSDRMNDSIPMA